MRVLPPCEMITPGWIEDYECRKPAVGWHETVPVCQDCADVLRREGFEVVFNSLVDLFAQPSRRYP